MAHQEGMALYRAFLCSCLDIWDCPAGQKSSNMCNSGIYLVLIMRRHYQEQRRLTAHDRVPLAQENLARFMFYGTMKVPYLLPTKCDWFKFEKSGQRFLNKISIHTTSGMPISNSTQQLKDATEITLAATPMDLFATQLWKESVRKGTSMVSNCSSGILKVRTIIRSLPALGFFGIQSLPGKFKLRATP